MPNNRIESIEVFSETDDTHFNVYCGEWDLTAMARQALIEIGLDQGAETDYDKEIGVARTHVMMIKDGADDGYDGEINLSCTLVTNESQENIFIYIDFYDLVLPENKVDEIIEIIRQINRDVVEFGQYRLIRVEKDSEFTGIQVRYYNSLLLEDASRDWHLIKNIFEYGMSLTVPVFVTLLGVCEQ